MCHLRTLTGSWLECAPFGGQRHAAVLTRRWACCPAGFFLWSASTALAGGYYGSTRVYYDDPDIYDPVPSVVVTRRVVYAPPPPPVYHVRRTVYVGGPRPVPYYGHYGRGYYGGGFYGVRRAYYGPRGFYGVRRAYGPGGFYGVRRAYYGPRGFYGTRRAVYW